jgi:hypothetical protein
LALPVQVHCASALVHEPCVVLEPVGHAVVCAQAFAVHAHCGSVVVHEVCVTPEPVGQAVDWPHGEGNAVHWHWTSALVHWPLVVVDSVGQAVLCVHPFQTHASWAGRPWQDASVSSEEQLNAGEHVLPSLLN